MKYIVGGFLTCPECGKISVCPCKTCKGLREKENITEFREYQRDADGETVICPYCGFKENLTYWYSQAERNNKNFYI